MSSRFPFSLQAVVSWIGIISISVFFLPISLLAGWWLADATRQDLLARAQSLAAIMATQAVEPILLEDRHEAFQVLERGMAADSDLAYAFIMQADDHLVAHTFDGGFPRDLLRECLDRQEPVTSIHTEDGDILDVAVPVLDGALGHLHLGISQRRIVERQVRFNLLLLALLLPLLAATLYVARLIGEQIGRPLHLLAQNAHQVAHGGIRPENIEVAGTLEVQNLSLAFRDMLRDLRRLEAENKAALQRMVSAERLAATGQLAAGLAHEILNPLDGVMECCRQLEPHVAGTERPAKYLRLTRDGLSRIERVMRQLLVFARPGAPQAEFVTCQVDDIVRDVCELVHPRFTHDQIDLQAEAESGLRCICLRQNVEQALLNLLLNAADACRQDPHPTIRVTMGARPDWVDIHVEDNGGGVEPDRQAQIFLPFVSSKEPGKGTGLGLTTSRSLVEQCGGELLLLPEPATLGGAHFLIALPRDGSASHAATLSQSEDET